VVGWAGRVVARNSLPQVYLYCSQAVVWVCFVFILPVHEQCARYESVYVSAHNKEG